MSGSNHMYVTLPSNTPDYEATNRTNSFRVRLPEPVQLFGAWEVALVDIQYPRSWRNLSGKQQVILRYKTSVGSVTSLRGEMPAGYYQDVETLFAGLRLGIRDAARQIPMVEAETELALCRVKIMKKYPQPKETQMTDLVREVDPDLTEDARRQIDKPSVGESQKEPKKKKDDYIVFRQPLPLYQREQATAEEVAHDQMLYDKWVEEEKRYNEQRIEDAPVSKEELAFRGGITRGLGRVEVYMEEGKSINAVIIPKTVRYMLGLTENEIEAGRVYRAPYQPDLTAGLTTLYIHCSIVEPQIVGNCRSELLRTIPINSTHAFGDTIHELFTSPHYIGVLRRCFDQIQIEIRTDKGEPVPFEHGKVVVKLHFRKAKGQQL